METRYLKLIAASLMMIASVAAYADDEPAFVVNRYMTVEDGVTWLNMESYVTGKTVTVETEERIPSDIVLLMDTSASMESDSGYYVKNSTNTQWWSYNNIGKNGSHFVLYNGKYYGVKGTKQKRLTHDGHYWLYFDDDDNKIRYFLKTDSTTGEIIQGEPTAYTTAVKYWYGGTEEGEDGYVPKDIHGNVIKEYKGKDDKHDIWYGELYDSYTTAIGALREAAKKFIDEVYADYQNTGIAHRVALVQFNDNDYAGGKGSHNDDPWEYDTYTDPTNGDFLFESAESGVTSVVKRFVTIDGADDVSAMQSALDDVDPAWDTASDFGLRLTELLYNHFGPDPDDLVSKTVVMFTDGVPNYDDDPLDSDVANRAIQISKGLKDLGVNVYTVGILDKDRKDYNQMVAYMNGVSSNYPKAESMNSLGEGGNKGFFIDATKEYLTDVFATIARQTTTGGASIEISEKAVVKEVLSSSFEIPLGYDKTKIVTKVSDYNSGSWGAWKTPSPSVTTDIQTSSGTISISVTGYDYSGHWCGQGASNGQKLLIKIPVAPKQGIVGGEDIPVTGEGAGVFVDDASILETDKPVAKMDVPVNITISKAGLAKGKSAIFVIYVNTNSSYPSVTGSTPTWEVFTRVLMTGVNDDGRVVTATLKDLAPKVYKIEESDWSWTYEDSTGAKTTLDCTVNPISFVNTATSTSYKNAEAVVSNNLKSK